MNLNIRAFTAPTVAQNYSLEKNLELVTIWIPEDLPLHGKNGHVGYLSVEDIDSQTLYSISACQKEKLSTILGPAVTNEH